MTYALVAHTVGFSTTSNGFTSSSINTTGADLLIVGLSEGGGVNNGTIFDSKGNSWGKLTQAINNGKSSELWFAWNPIVGTGHTFSVTGTTDFPALCVAAFSGSQTTSSPFDVQNSANALSASTLATGSITPGSANELVVTCLQSDGQGLAATISGGFTVLDSTTDASFGHQSASFAYLIQTTATAANPTWTRPSGSSTITANIASFRIPPTYESTILNESSLQSYWKLSETVGAGTVADSKGAVTGTPNAGVTLGAGGLLLSDTTTSASFNGTSGGISMGANYGEAGTVSFSVECWYQTPSSFDGAQHYLVCCEDNDGTGNRQGWHLGVNPSNEFYAGRFHSTALNVDAVYGTALVVSTVYHLVMTYDGTNTRLYVNAGAATVGAADANSILAVATAPVFGVGGFNGGTFYYATGQIGHVAVYNAVLTTTQITAHYSAGTAVPAVPHVAIGQRLGGGIRYG